MTKKKTGLIWGIVIAVVLLFILGSNFGISADKEGSMVKVNSYFDANSNLIKTLSVVNGIEGVKYLNFKITIRNTDSVARTYSITEFSDLTAKPTNKLTIEPNQTKSFTTGLVDIEQYEGTTKEFCATAKSEAIDSLREEGLPEVGCVSIKIDPNPTGSFDITIEQGTGTADSPPASCVENWVCSSWSICGNGLQSRTCSDSSNCGTTANKPTESQSCTSISYSRFRTSDLNYGSTSAIAYSTSCGSQLTAYGQDGVSSASCSTLGFTIIGKATGNYDLCTRNGYPTKLYVQVGSSLKIYESSDPDKVNVIISAESVDASKELSC